MVGRCPANKLTGRGPIPRRLGFPAPSMRRGRSIRYHPRFPGAVPERGAGCPRVTQPFATLFPPEGGLTVRLACVRRAASVHPEPGSNSPSKDMRRAYALPSIGIRSSLLPVLADLDSSSICQMELNRRVLLGSADSTAHVCLPISSIAVSGSQGSPALCPRISGCA